MKILMNYFYPLTGCVSGFKYHSRCVEFFKERVTWAQARKLCQTLHGDLVVIQDDKKQKFIYDNFAAGKTLWIGLRRKHVG